MVVAGCDISTKAVDIVLLDSTPGCLHPVRHHRFELTGQDAFDRARDVVEAIPGGWWTNQHVAALGIEDPRGQNTGVIYRVQGAVLATVPSCVAVTPWVPSEWRKAVGLPGNASKADIQWFVRGRDRAVVAYELWSQDACDAYCIALATRERTA